MALFGLLGGDEGAGDPLDLYGDLFTDKQKAALRQRELSSGLLRFAEKLGAASAPSRAPKGSFLGLLGQSLGGFAGGDEAANKQLEAMALAEKVRASKQQRGFANTVAGIAQQLLAQEKSLGLPPGTLTKPYLAANGGAGAAAPAPAGAPAGQPPSATAADAAAAPPAPQIGSPPGPMPDSDELSRVSPWAVGIPQQDLSRFGIPMRPTVGQTAAPGPQTGLLPPPPGVPNPQMGAPGGVLSASLYNGGAAPGMPPFSGGGSPPGTAGPDLQQLAQLMQEDAGGGGDAGEGNWQRDKPLIRKYESGGRNIEQGVVGPRGGYNPSVGRVTGPSSASGYYQMIDPTWRAAAAKVGIDTQKYPRAINAPEELQDKAAEALYREQGLRPWAPYNRALAAATGYSGGTRMAGAPDLSNMAGDAGGGGDAGEGGKIPGLNISPQGLAALNMLSKLGGLGDPFGSLLETYYKSPNYITEAARARALGENDPLIIEQKKRLEYKIDTELKPGLEAAVAREMNGPLKERAQNQAEIDRRSEQLKQLGVAGTKIEEATVAGDDGKPVQRKMTALEIAIREKLTAERRAAGDMTVRPGDIVGTPVLSPGETTGQQKSAELPYTTKDVQLNWPDGTSRKVTLTGQQAKDAAEGKPVPAVGWPGTMSGGTIGEEVLPSGHAEATTVLLKERRPKAEAAVQSLQFNDVAKQLLDAGVITGTGAGLRLDVAKAKSLFGWDDARIATTEAFLGTQARQVASVLSSGAFGSGSSITEEDRRQVANLVGQNTTLDEKSLRFLVNLTDTAANWEIDRYSADVNKHDPKGRLPILRVDRPPKAETKANQPTPVGEATLGNQPFTKWSDGKWRPRGELPGEEKR